MDDIVCCVQTATPGVDSQRLTAPTTSSVLKPHRGTVIRLRQFSWLVATASLFACGSATVTADATVDAPVGPVNSVDGQRIADDLAFIGQERPSGSLHWQAVADLCASRFEAAGLAVERHNYGSGVNIIGRGQGTSSTATDVIVSAHYDSTVACNGAADDGAGVAAVLEVVEELEVTRVGHGIAAAADPGLMRQLAAAGIVLEICPTSNRRTGAWDASGPHPLFTLLEHGVPCILGSDDPAYFGSSLRGELAWVEGEGLDQESIEALCARSLSCGFA